MTIQSLYNRRNELRAAIEQMAGRKGVSALRSELETLNARLTELDARRSQMKANINSQNAKGRGESYVNLVRKTLNSFVGAQVKRGYYDELVFVLENVYISQRYALALARRCMTHPNIRPFAGYLQALDTLSSAIADGVIEKTDAEFDDRGRGTATNHDLYGYSNDGTLILVQVRHASVTRYGTNVKIQYFVTDGDDAIEIVKGKGNIKRAAQADPTPDSPLRFLRPQLKGEWRNKLDEQPVKLAGPKVGEYVVWKILHDDAGTLRSVYSGEEYIVGKSKVQKAQDDHNGGYYGFLDCDIAIRVHRDGRAFNASLLSNKRLVLCRGRAWGRPVEYSSGKRAFSRMIIDEVIRAI